MTAPEIIRRLQDMRERLKADEVLRPSEDLALREAIAYIRAKEEQPVYFLARSES